MLCGALSESLRGCPAQLRKLSHLFFTAFTSLNINFCATLIPTLQSIRENSKIGQKNDLNKNQQRRCHRGDARIVLDSRSVHATTAEKDWRVMKPSNPSHSY